MNTNLLNSQYVAAAHAERTADLTAAWRRPAAAPTRANRVSALLQALRRPAAAR